MRVQEGEKGEQSRTEGREDEPEKKGGRKRHGERPICVVFRLCRRVRYFFAVSPPSRDKICLETEGSVAILVSLLHNSLPIAFLPERDLGPALSYERQMWCGTNDDDDDENNDGVEECAFERFIKLGGNTFLFFPLSFFDYFYPSHFFGVFYLFFVFVLVEGSV